MEFSLQPVLENEYIALLPLEENDFEALYAVASDPLIWEQHPNKDRWKREVFERFFAGALESGGAFKIVDKTAQRVIGSTRFYDVNPENNSLLIGYTFYDRAYWGTGTNKTVKRLMLNYAFQFAETVFFHIGKENQRSRIAIERLGAQLVGEEDIAYYGEAPKLNCIYALTKADITGW